MGEFADDKELLQDFLVEAGEMLDDVDCKLVELEKAPDDAELLNVIFRGFHTIKGGAGFLDANALVDLCHRTENVFDLLRGGKLQLTPDILDVVLDATAEVRRMFDEMQASRLPEAAPQRVLDMLTRAAAGELVAEAVPPAEAPSGLVAAVPAVAVPTIAVPAVAVPRSGLREPDWVAFYNALVGAGKKGRPAADEEVEVDVGEIQADQPDPSVVVQSIARVASPPRAPSDRPKSVAGKGESRTAAKEATLRIDTARFDQILNLSGEIGLIRTRLTCLAAKMGQKNGDLGNGDEAVKAIPAIVGELDTLVGDLQNAVMKARMQPVGRVFQKYVRLARDLGRQLGKDIDLELVGENTEVDKTILEELNDPLVHLLRNAVDHGVENMEERRAAGKPPTASVRISAAQAGDQIVIEISDDGKGMRAELIRERAVEKGLIPADEAASLGEKESLNLIFLPGFSTKNEITDVSGRGVGMDVVKTNIRKLNGRIEIVSVPGRGSVFTITLPLTLAILPVLVLKIAGQPYAVPLAAVREVIEIGRERVQQVSGRDAIVVRGEVLPLLAMADVLHGTSGSATHYGVVVMQGHSRVILGVDAVAGQADVMIKPLAGIKPRGVAGATLSGEGELVLVLDLNELLDQ